MSKFTLYTHYYKNEDSIKMLLIVKFLTIVTIQFTPTTHTPRRTPEDPPPNLHQKFKSYHMNLQLVE